MRLDKYLKVSRLIKRRTVANEVADAGRILINGKVAKASATTSLPSYDRMDAMPDNLLSNLSFILIKSSILGFVVPNGRPRYVKGRLSVLQPNTSASARHLSDETLMGTIDVLL